MDYRVEGQAAYVLHTRAYRDTSAIVELFTLEHGRVAAVSKGMRRANSKSKALLQPFIPLQVNWQGRNELKTLTLAESTGFGGFLTGDALMCALYANELLLKLLAVFDPHPKLFVYYQYLINSLLENDIEVSLRIFERQLLKAIGYAADFSDLEANAVYFFDLKQLVFKKVATIDDKYKALHFWGEHLLAIDNDDYETQDVKKAAKRFSRLQFDRLLQGQVLSSRSLFQKKVKPNP